MALRMVKAGKIADGTVRLMGWEPDAYTLSGRDRETLTDSVNEGLAELYGAQKWPQLVRVELRTYRPAHSMTETYAAGNEVWLADAEADEGGDYWKALAANTGVLPADGGGVWERAEELIKFIALEQDWEAWAIDENGVDLEDFAFEDDPRVNPDLHPIEGCRFWMDSVILPKEAPKRVYVKFVPRRPAVDYTEWLVGTAYVRGDVRYRTATGTCYTALRDNTGATPETSPDDWAEVGIPEIFAVYLKLRALAAWKTEDDGRGKAVAAAEDELGRLADRCITRQNVRQGGYSAGR